MKVNKYKFLNFILLIIFYIVLEFSYIYFVHQNFEYHGFTFTFSIVKYLISKVLFLLVLIYQNNKKLSDFIYFISSLFITLLLIPNLILFQFIDIPITISFSIFLFQILLIFSGTINFKKIVNFGSIEVKNKENFLAVLIIIMLIPFIFAYRMNFNFDVLLLEDIYETRAENAEKSNIFIDYFLSWLAKILVPLGLIFSLKNKKYFSIAFMFIALVYLFLASAQKTIFFTAFIVFVFYFVKGYLKQISLLLTGLIGLLIISHFLYVFAGNIFVESLLSRRLFFVPAYLNYCYFDYFDGNHLYYSHSFLSKFIEYKYSVDPSFIISDIYFQKPDMRSNNGFISDGFMNLGYIGVLLHSILTIVLFKIFDNQKFDSDFSGLFFIIVFTLLSSYFFTSLLTHGILIFVVLSFILLKKRDGQIS